MTTPLVYVFAATAVVLFVGFLLSAWLAFRHARQRGRYAKELSAYITESGARVHELDEKRVESLAAERERVMHITIGDLVRDPVLSAAATRGIVARRETIRQDPAQSDGSDSEAAEPSP